jgi:hypothetical protein
MHGLVVGIARDDVLSFRCAKLAEDLRASRADVEQAELPARAELVGVLRLDDLRGRRQLLDRVPEVDQTMDAAAPERFAVELRREQV